MKIFNCSIAIAIATLSTAAQAGFSLNDLKSVGDKMLAEATEMAVPESQSPSQTTSRERDTQSTQARVELVQIEEDTFCAPSWSPYEVKGLSAATDRMQLTDRLAGADLNGNTGFHGVGHEDYDHTGGIAVYDGGLPADRIMVDHYVLEGESLTIGGAPVVAVVRTLSKSDEDKGAFIERDCSLSLDFYIEKAPGRIAQLGEALDSRFVDDFNTTQAYTWHQRDPETGGGTGNTAKILNVSNRDQFILRLSFVGEVRLEHENTVDSNDF